ncbi:MAG: ABC transporter permease, partial [Phycisphaerae bacterium]|nr:ABC transporter permease [Gemmatimonadaceae bacterium]
MKGPIFQPKVETRVDDELAFHVEMHTRDLIARGTSPAEARRQAEATLGDRKRLTDECKRLDHDIERSERRTLYLSELLQDAHFALRMLSRRRTFAAIAIATLAIGIGAATAIYSIVDSVLLRPLPFSEPDRIGALWIREPEMAKNPAVAYLAEAMPVGNEEYQAIKAASKTISAVALYTSSTAFVTGSDGTERIGVGKVTSTIFDVLRLRMTLGRRFVNGDDALHSAPVALVSWESWQSKYNGDTAILGKSVVLDREPYTIVGVLPKGVRLLRNDPEIRSYWVPALRDSGDLVSRHNRNYQALARLAPGATFQSASAELSRIVSETVRDSTTGARVEEWQRDESSGSRRTLFGLLGASMFLLVIACVNVAMLLLGEAANRGREMAARAALGAGSGRLARQLLVESLVIAFISALCGSALAWAMMRGLVALAPTYFPGVSDAAIDGRVLAFATALATATGLLFGVAPAISVGRNAISSLARTGTGQSNRKSALLQRGLIATQLALSMVLLTDAFLLSRSFRQLASVDPGFVSQHLSAVRIVMPYQVFQEAGKNRFTAHAIQQRFASLPGVSRAVLASGSPFAGGYGSSPVLVEGADKDSPNARGVHTQQRYVSAGYFETLGFRLIRGRFFNANDVAGGLNVAVLSEAQVKRDFPGRNPIGLRIRHQGQWREVVGVVSDVKHHALKIEPDPTLYVPFDQYPSTSFFVIVREGA